MDTSRSNWLLCCDWGTTSLRLQLVEADTLKTRAKTSDGEGILATYRRWTASGQPASERLFFYLAVLRDCIHALESQGGSSLSGVPLVVSGMASSSIGMSPLPYRPLPLALDGSNLQWTVLPTSDDFLHPLLLVSGVSAKADVMRGEETLLVGALADNPLKDQAAVVVLPGTHSKHVSIRNEQVEDFATYMTGEFFALLSQYSILADTVDSGGGLDVLENRESFADGVRDGAASNLLRECFSIRARHLLGTAIKNANYHRLSGLLIGAELGDLVKRKPEAVMLLSSPHLQLPYQLALHVLSPGTRLVNSDADAALLRGQRAAAAHAGLLSNRVVA